MTQPPTKQEVKSKKARGLLIDVDKVSEAKTYFRSKKLSMGENDNVEWSPTILNDQS